MNKQEYLVELEKELKAAHVRDSAEILEEYAEHFDMKLQDGYGEEEIAARLSSPKNIADQFADIKTVGGVEVWKKVLVTIGLVYVDILAGASFIMLYMWAVALLGCVAIASAGLGVFAAAGLSLGNIIPEMPYICALLLGLALLALAVLSTIGAEHSRLYITQLLRAYIRWHKTVMGDGGRPPLTMQPQIKAKKRRIMRNIAIISLLAVAVFFISGLGSMMIASGSLEPWHVWHWFE